MHIQQNEQNLQIKLTIFLEMLNIQSPQFSSSSKIDLASRLSPCLRNKRIPSTQQCYPCQWNRANSCKKLDSPSKISEKNRKRSHHSYQRVKNKINLSHNIAEQLHTLKNQYSSIKIAYQDLIQNKIKNDEQVTKVKLQSKKYKQQNDRLIKQNDRLKSKICFLQMEIQRIKKQSLKLLQIQQFKAKKLEQNLYQKQKAISSLIQSFKVDSSMQINQIYISESDQQPTTQATQNNNINDRVHLQSLTLSQDKTLSNSQFISISLTSMMQNQSQIRHDLSTKRNNISYSNVQAQKIQILDASKEIPNSQPSFQVTIINKQNESKPVDSFKKFRKQIAKKIEVNIEERNKQVGQQSAANKNGLDRKNSKSHKASKTKLRKDDQSSQHRSSKKKITHK